MSKARGYGIDITLTGVGAAARAMRAYDRNLSERMVRDLRRPAMAIAANARGRYPVVSGASRRGIRVKLERQSRSPFQLKIQQKARGGSIIEFAATPRTDQGRSLVATLDARYGAPGRIMWAAWDAKKTQFEDDIKAAVLRVDREIQAALDQAAA